MTPSALKYEIVAKAQELAAAITTTDGMKDNPEKIKAAIEDVMLEAAEGAIKVILTAYGEYSKTSPAYDRMKAVLVEVKSA